MLGVGVIVSCARLGPVEQIHLTQFKIGSKHCLRLVNFDSKFLLTLSPRLCRLLDFVINVSTPERPCYLVPLIELILRPFAARHPKQEVVFRPAIVSLVFDLVCVKRVPHPHVLKDVVSVA